MNNIRKALRYIYIYILTSKAGLEYDLQSREVWKWRKSEASNHTCADQRHVLHKRRGAEESDDRGRLFDGCGKHLCCKTGLQRHTQNRQCNVVNVRFLPERVAGERRLTSKEVAA